MAQGSAMDPDMRRRFMYLFERVGEPLAFSPRGGSDSMVMYSIPNQYMPCQKQQHASQVTQEKFLNMSTPGGGGGSMKRFDVQPVSVPDLSSVGRLCPKTTLYNYFNPNHRNACKQLMDVMGRGGSLEEIFRMSCACRDNPDVNCKVWINAMAGVVLRNPQLQNTPLLPAPWEVMPDLFFSAFTMRQAYRQAELPMQDRGMIVVDEVMQETGRAHNPEQALAYWREDMGVNSHHWHWHLIYRLDDPAMEGRRKGELFYYMHHAMIARYDSERLGAGMKRVMALSIDDNPMLNEGYFGKLTDSNSGRNWGTRQSMTPLRNLNRTGETGLPQRYATANLADLRKYRDRVVEAIDTGFILRERDNARVPLDIDVLGDMIEASSLTPNGRLYSPDGIHNLGHVLIAYSHDPEYKHFENVGPMGDTTTAMRDPVFYRWHKYIDILYDMHKQTLQPYQDKGGEFPLGWPEVQVQSVQVQHATFGSKLNELETFFMKSHVDLSRGLDFLRYDANRLGPIWLQITHLNHEPFNYTITVRNTSRSPVRATVRIYLAPRFDEQGDRFLLEQQRKLYFELDKFSHQLNPGENTINRKSTDSTVTVPWEQSFRDLERGVEQPTAEQSICGCGWPQHMLLPRGSPTGQSFDLVVFLTKSDEDLVKGTTPASSTPGTGQCKEALSYCGRLGQPYPDRKPMGYPFDRNPFTVVDPANQSGEQVPAGLDDYVRRCPNFRYIEVKVKHNKAKVITRNDGGPKEALPQIPGNASMSNASSVASGCQEGARAPGRAPGSMTAASSTSTTWQQPPNRRPGSPPGPQQGWQGGDRGRQGQWYRPQPQRPQSPHGGWQQRGPNSRPGSPNWGWGG